MANQVSSSDSTSKAMKRLWKSKHLAAFYQECTAANIRPFVLLAGQTGSDTAPQCAAANIPLVEAKMLVAQLKDTTRPSMDHRPLNLPDMPTASLDLLCDQANKGKFERYCSALRKTMCPGRYLWNTTDMPIWAVKFDVSRYSATAKVCTVMYQYSIKSCM